MLGLVWDIWWREHCWRDIFDILETPEYCGILGRMLDMFDIVGYLAEGNLQGYFAYLVEGTLGLVWA